MPIRDNDPRPAYEQLADELRQAIAVGDYEPGDRLPSISALQDEHGIASMTVRKGLGLLEDQGLVVARQGRGVFVLPPQPAAETHGSDPLTAVRDNLAETMHRLQEINDRLDRYDTARSHDTDPATEQAADVSADLNPVMAEIIANLTEANAALDKAEQLETRLEPTPGLDHPPPPARDTGPELGM